MRSLLIAPALSLFLATSSFAQTATSGSNSNSTSDSASAANAQALAAAITRLNANQHSSFRSPKQPGAIGVPGLAASSGCMGSTSLGLSVLGGGGAAGSTWQDQRCNAREDARLLLAMGYPQQAIQLLVQYSPMVASVMAPAGSVTNAYRPVSLEASPNPPAGDRCQANLGLLQQQDAYLTQLIRKKGRADAKFHLASLVQQNLRTGVDNVRLVCPAALARTITPEVEGRIGQIDHFIESGKWEGPLG